MLQLGSFVRGIVSNTVLLCHMDGENNSTTFIDSSALNATITPVGNAKISIIASMFGGTSAQFDGADDGLSIPLAGGLGAGDFTIEMWIRPGVLSGFRTLFMASSLYGFGLTGASAAWWSNGSPTATTPTMSTFTWYHVACTRSSGVIRTFLNGTVSGSTFSSTFDLNFNTWYVGCLSDLSRDYSGFIDELRVTRGVALYTTNFTVPTAPFPN
jgi:hypothetical protein